MAFYTAISGLNAAAKNLAVTSNNIANANTTGFKQSRAEFADVYASSVSGVSKVQPGSGVRLTNVAQQFTQGNINATGNNLDLAVSGEGFFSLASNASSDQPTIFTRSGEFKLDKEGYIVNNQGNFLMGFKPNGTTAAEGFNSGLLPLKLNAEQGSPVATTAIGISANLQSTKNAPLNSPVNPADPNSYSNVSPVTIYDSQGNSHIASTYYVSQSPTTPNTWSVYLFIDGKPFNADGSAAPLPIDGSQTSVTMTFDTEGKLTAPSGRVTYGPIASTDIDPSLNVSDLNLSLDYAGTTQFSSEFAVNSLEQNGLPAGNLSGISISDDGIVFAKFSNGGSTPLGKVALSRFANPQGLAKLGDSTWAQSSDSGERIPGEPGTGSFGVIQSGSIEAANVELSEQLVNLIIGQQAYQANAQTISTEDTITQTIINIR